MGKFSYIFGFIEGILTFVSPCILPLIPVYFFYLAGTMEKEGGNGTVDKVRMLVNSLGFVAGFTIVFVTLGAIATSLGQFLKSHIDILRKLSGIIMVIFGLNFMGVLKLGFINTEKRFDYQFKELKFFSSVIFGAVFGFGWTPCAGAFLGSALLMASSSETLWQGISLLFVYSLGLGVPFILAALIFDKAKNSMGQIQKHSRIIGIISGIVLILAGILVFTDKLKYLGALT